MTVAIYLDYNATTPVDPVVADVIGLYLREHFGNPSSGHPFGRRAREAVEAARAEVAALIGAQPQEIVFTGSASEANNMAVLGTARAQQHRGRHIITSAVEHPSVAQPVLHLQAEGWEVTTIPVDQHGRVDPEAVRGAIRPETVLVTVMHANNEVGTVEPIAEIAAIVRERGICMHTDAAQSAGKIPVAVDALGVDLLTLAGHKFYAPKGIGALYIRTGTAPAPVLFGAGQEGGRRTGTENVPYIAGFGAAARLARDALGVEEAALRRKRERLHRHLQDNVPGLMLNGHPDYRLPNTLNVSFPRVDGRLLLERLDGLVAASVGAACHAGDATVSGVLGAMGLEPDRASGAVRLSVGRLTTEQEIDRAARALVNAWQECRGADDGGSASPASGAATQE